ncbi:hypothetical protein M514_01976 [Trichuris suis]|uniref:Uncharacterized protein n=1 Tax=Trichuris suis TaxID=68888 RepID=A0A085NJG7_9BILA|nr:hypothetical protein M513_01976 [Trichuris suis]KFD69613.1 hypothetical protein M514_01976 [Trichuris suis]
MTNEDKIHVISALAPKTAKAMAPVLMWGGSMCRKTYSNGTHHIGGESYERLCNGKTALLDESLEELIQPIELVSLLQPRKGMPPKSTPPPEKPLTGPAPQPFPPLTLPNGSMLVPAVCPKRGIPPRPIPDDWPTLIGLIPGIGIPAAPMVGIAIPVVCFPGLPNLRGGCADVLRACACASKFSLESEGIVPSELTLVGYLLSVGSIDDSPIGLNGWATIPAGKAGGGTPPDLRAGQSAAAQIGCRLEAAILAALKTPGKHLSPYARQKNKASVANDEEVSWTLKAKTQWHRIQREKYHLSWSRDAVQQKEHAHSKDSWLGIHYKLAEVFLPPFQCIALQPSVHTAYTILSRQQAKSC